MEKERQFTVINLILNSMITLMKIYAGMVFGSYTLMVGGYYALSVMSQEFIAFSGSIARGRRASQKEPFGFGKLESFSCMLFGFILILLSIYIFVKSFFLDYVKTDLRILVVIVFVYVLKRLNAKYLFNIGKRIQSEMLIESAHNAYKDTYVTILILAFIIISAIFPLADHIGSILIGVFILYKGLKIIWNNIVMLHGQNDQAKSVIKNVKKIVDSKDYIDYSNCSLVNVHNFYKVTIEILIDNNLSIKELLKRERRVKSRLKHFNKNIKMVDFLIYVK